MANDLGLFLFADGRLRRTNYMDEVRILGTWNSDEEVVRLDVPVDERLLMDCLYTGDLLIVLVSKDGRSIMAQPKREQRSEWS